MIVFYCGSEWSGMLLVSLSQGKSEATRKFHSMLHQKEFSIGSKHPDDSNRFVHLLPQVICMKPFPPKTISQSHDNSDNSTQSTQRFRQPSPYCQPIERLLIRRITPSEQAATHVRNTRYRTISLMQSYRCRNTMNCENQMTILNQMKPLAWGRWFHMKNFTKMMKWYEIGLNRFQNIPFDSLVVYYCCFLFLSLVTFSPFWSSDTKTIVKTSQRPKNETNKPKRNGKKTQIEAKCSRYRLNNKREWKFPLATVRCFVCIYAMDTHSSSNAIYI